MATHDYVISNASGAAVRADLNNALAAIVSNNSNATEPSTTYSYMLWADTGSSPPVMKLRNAANDGWVTLFQLDGEWTSIAFEDGTAAAPSIYFKDSGTDTGLFSGGTDQVNVSTGGTERVEWGTSEVVFNDGGENYDFRIEGDTNSSLFFVDASADTVEINGDATITDKIIHSGDTNTAIRFPAADTVSVETGGSERCRVDDSGRLLVGTSSDITGSTNNVIQAVTTAGARLALGRDDASVSAGDDLGLIQFFGNDGGTFEECARIFCEADDTHAAGDKPSRLVFSTTADGASSPTERLRIDKGGNIVLASASTLYTLWSYNNTSANAANTYIDGSGVFRRSTSSIKYKTNVETLQDQYADALLSCRPVWYRSTCDADCPEHSWWGFIAEEVAEIDPRLVQWKTVEVTYDENGSAVETPCDPEPEGVAYDRFVPHLVNLIKRQQQAIETLEAKVAALESA